MGKVIVFPKKKKKSITHQKPLSIQSATHIFKPPQQFTKVKGKENKEVTGKAEIQVADWKRSVFEVTL